MNWHERLRRALLRGDPGAAAAAVEIARAAEWEVAKRGWRRRDRREARDVEIVNCAMSVGRRYAEHVNLPEVRRHVVRHVVHYWRGEWGRKLSEASVDRLLERAHVFDRLRRGDL